MDISYTARPATFGAVINTIAYNIFGGISSSLVAAFKEHQTRRALAKLSPRQLEDIGLTQGDISKIARPVTLLH